MQLKFKKIFLLVVVQLIINDFLCAQQSPAKKDSSKIYKDIESYSKRSKFNKLVYELIFKHDVTKSTSKNVNKNKNSYKSFEGRIIRNINIVTLDPFGYSVSNDIFQSQNILFKAGNKLHVRSQHITIRNLLLIHQYQIFDSLLVKESERLVRSQKYVHDVSFYFAKTSLHSDSVDIFINELDNWSIIPEIEASASRISFDLTDKNIFGLGHEFRNAFTWIRLNDKIAFNTNYAIPNFRNTYISGLLHYGIDEYKNFNKSLSVERPFFSPLAKWAAGLLISQQYKKDSINYHHFGFVPILLKYNTQDYWFGKAQQVFFGNTEEERSTNLILAGRFIQVRYLLRPNEIYDSLHAYSDEKFYLISMGISYRKYIKDKYIFNYGITEDVPVGKVYSLTGGYQIKNSVGRFYFGARYSIGNFFEWGYLSRSLEYGTFVHGSHVEQGAVVFTANYFTNLFKVGSWKFRQFVKPQLTLGINRFGYDSLTFHDGNGLDGFNSQALTGTNRFLLTFQTQSYAPWYFLGFRFGPYINYSIGILGDDVSVFKKSRMYSSIGLGVLIKNENLVINTFQFSISFYPSIPGNGLDIFKLNSFQTTNFGFKDFEIGKPEIVLFR